MSRQNLFLGMILVLSCLGAAVYRSNHTPIEKPTLRYVKTTLESKGKFCQAVDNCLIVSEYPLSFEEASQFKSFTDPKKRLVRLSRISPEENFEESDALRVVCNGRFWCVGDPSLVTYLYELLR